MIGARHLEYCDVAAHFQFCPSYWTLAGCQRSSRRSRRLCNDLALLLRRSFLWLLFHPLVLIGFAGVHWFHLERLAVQFLESNVETNLSIPSILFAGSCFCNDLLLRAGIGFELGG